MQERTRQHDRPLGGTERSLSATFGYLPKDDVEAIQPRVQERSSRMVVDGTVYPLLVHACTSPDASTAMTAAWCGVLGVLGVRGVLVVYWAVVY